MPRSRVPQSPPEAPVEPPKPIGLVGRAAAGDQLGTLEALRDLLARTITETDSGRDVAALSRQITDVLKLIEAVKRAAPEQKGTALDEITRRIAERQSGAPRRARP